MTAPQTPLRPGAGATPAGGALEGFAAAGGLSESLAMLGIHGAPGIDLNADACAVAEAAGHPRRTADIRGLAPEAFPDAQVWISGPPCPTFSTAGLRSGVAELEQLRRGIEAVSDWPEMPGGFSDPRTALVLETLRFAVQLPNVRVVIAEQVPDVRPVWIEMCAELATFHRFAAVDVVTVAADDVGTPTRRKRVFLIAHRDEGPDLSALPYRERWSSGRFADGITEHVPNTGHRFPRLSMAEALDWPAGVRVNTRGARKTAGGNEFSADGPVQSLTGRARTWYRTDLGPVDGRLTPVQAGLLQGFPAGYPWYAASSRTSAFQRIADSVCPMVGAAVIGSALGLPWEDAVRQRIADLYGPDAGRVEPEQLTLAAVG